MKRHFLYIVLFLFAVEGFSQGCFTVDKPRGCAPLTINLTNCYTGGGTIPTYDYGDGNYVTNTTMTFFTPGTYTITQRIFQSGTLTHTEVVEVLPSPTPTFKIETCTNNLINLIIKDSNYDKYIIDYGDGSPTITVNPLTTNTHTYSGSTSRTVSVQGAYLPLMCGAVQTQNITPMPSLIAPDLQKLQVTDQSNNGKIVLSFIAQSNQKYIVEQRIIGNPSYTTIDTLKNLIGLNQYSITTGINTQTNQYGYRITAVDDCGNQAPSSEIVSLINKVVAGNNQNIITWNGIPSSLSNYQIIKNQNTSAPLTTTTGTSFTDAPILCGEVNCYYITAAMTTLNSSGAQLISISDTVCSTGVSNLIPAAVQNFNSSYIGDFIQLSWDLPTAGVKTFTIQRNDGVTYNLPTNQNTNIIGYSDRTINVSSTYCYQISYEDDCGNISPTTTNGTCAVKLTVEINPSDLFENLLSWTPYSGSDGPFSYFIEKLDDNGQIISTTPSSSLNVTDNISGQSVQVVRYRIKVVDAAGQIFYSEIVEIKYEGDIKFPTAFTPNGDGHNDIFISINKFIKEYQLTIYNRWGEVVFNSIDPKEGWDGMYKGQMAISDTYSYLVVITDLWGKSMTRRGTVTLLK